MERHINTVKELIDLIDVTPVVDRTYVGSNSSVGSANVFGGQVLSQALSAAYKTVPEDRFCHSLHAYFILPGNLEKPIYFKVQKVRDGGSFTTRYVTAEQEYTPIFLLSSSFQLKQEGYDHQIKMPEVPDPDSLYSWVDIYEQTKEFLPKGMADFLSRPRPIIFKPTIINNPMENVDLPPYLNVWFKLKEPHEKIDLPLAHQLLAYISDYNTLTTALQPHASVAHFGNTQLASLDHAMWFHRDTDLSDWMLFSIETPSASNARGFTHGNIFTKDGVLIASIAQEGLMRPRLKK